MRKSWKKILFLGHTINWCSNEGHRRSIIVHVFCLKCAHTSYHYMCIIPLIHQLHGNSQEWEDQNEWCHFVRMDCPTTLHKPSVQSDTIVIFQLPYTDVEAAVSIKTRRSGSRPSRLSFELLVRYWKWILLVPHTDTNSIENSLKWWWHHNITTFFLRNRCCHTCSDACRTINKSSAHVAW